ncbi:hypothetical protein L7F22_061243 [Adiantum nelumboides]|nr:hypothetical protein [Adiantum nelumboides]
MRSEGLSPDAITYASVDMGKKNHDNVTGEGLLKVDIVLGTTLVGIYADCVVLLKAQKVQSSYAKFARDRSFLELNDVYLALQEIGYSLDQPAFYTACQSFDPNKLGKFRLDDYISLCIFLQSARNLFGAFDTKKAGRVALDFNQFVYCAANLRL